MLLLVYMVEKIPEEQGDIESFELSEVDPKTISQEKIPSYSAINLDSLSKKKSETPRLRRGPSWKNRLLGFSMLLGGFFGATKEGKSTEGIPIKNSNEHGKEKLTPEVAALIEKRLPKGVMLKNVEKLNDGYYYQDPNTGVMVKIDM